jgi:hypothetical protein
MRSIRRHEIEGRVLTAVRGRFFEPRAFATFCEDYTEELNRLYREHRVHLAGAPREVASIKQRSQRF